MKAQCIVGLATAVALAAASPRAEVAAVEIPRAAVDHLALSPNYVPLRKVTMSPEETARRRHKRHVAAPLDPPAKLPGTTGLANSNDIYYIVDITVGNQTVPVSIDTGSSDTWMVQQPLQCVDMAHFRHPASWCGFTDGFHGNLSQGMLPDRQFWRSYTDGTFVAGSFGFEDVTIGGITAKHQQLAIVNYTYWFGDGLTAGLLGLGYPLMTGMDGSDDPTHQYDPVFTTMWKQSLTPPLFSIALSREGKEKDESYLAFGGLPPVEVNDATWVKTPIQLLQSLPAWRFVESSENGLYVVNPDAYVIGKPGGNVTTLTTKYPVIIDVGASLSVLPASMVRVLYESFDPPATYLSEQGLFFAPCNATAPTFGVQIGGQLFHVSAGDLLRQGVRDRETGTLCRIGVTDDDDGPHILGVTFLANVVAVFDIGNNEMRFAARNNY